MKRIEEIDYIIGDLVKNDNAIVRIVKCSLYDPNPYVAAPDKNKDIGYWQANRKNIKPIPLTPAILEKNGWKKNDGVYLDESHHLMLYEKYQGYTLYKVINEKVIWLMNILYVHELQHLLFGLGINLDMEV